MPGDLRCGPCQTGDCGNCRDSSRCPCRHELYGIEQPEAGMAGAHADISSELLTPMYDAADGMRAELERRGWSPTAAEAAALTYLQGATQHFWTAAMLQLTNGPTP